MNYHRDVNKKKKEMNRQRHQLSPTSKLLIQAYSSAVDASLTDDERLEFQQNPVGSDGMENLSAERMRLRKSIAEKIWIAVKDDATRECDADQKKVYEAFPPYRFYTDKDCLSRARRAYGICKYDGEKQSKNNGDSEKSGGISEKNIGTGDKTYGLHMVSAMMLYCNDVFGGVPVDSVVAVEEWSEEQKQIIRLCPCPSLFFDPCAWIVFPYC